MAANKVFHNVTEPLWQRVKAESSREHGTVYSPPEAREGTSTTTTPVGPVVLRFAFDETTGTVEYSIEEKPMFVSEAQIWSVIEKAFGEYSGSAV